MTYIKKYIKGFCDIVLDNDPLENREGYGIEFPISELKTLALILAKDYEIEIDESENNGN